MFELVGLIMFYIVAWGFVLYIAIIIAPALFKGVLVVITVLLLLFVITSYLDPLPPRAKSVYMDLSPTCKPVFMAWWNDKGNQDKQDTLKYCVALTPYDQGYK